MAGTPTKERRTQAQRRESTRLALLNAALDQLVDGGMAGFTTPEVCRRAGVSQGALFKHFESKSALMAAMVEHMFDAMRDDYQRAFRDLGPDTELHLSIDLLWARMFDQRLAAAFELYTAARTDADLQRSLEPIVQAHCARLHVLAAELMPMIAPDQLAALVDLAILSMQGLAINDMAAADLERGARLRRSLDALLAAAMADTHATEEIAP